MADSETNLELTLGIEEEYFLIQPQSRELMADPDPSILSACRDYQGSNKFVPELLRSQIEANSKVCNSLPEVRQSLIEMRRTVRDACQRHGAEFIASSLHPVSSWNEQLISKGERYEQLSTALQHSSRQLIAGGMHIHASFGTADMRIAVMTSLRRYLPLLLALSTSSPLCESRLTGFKSYRHNLIGNLPRTGIPAAMSSVRQFEVLLAEYKEMQFVNDASEIWWDIRPSHSYPTIEVRICDLCPRIDDAMCVISMLTCLICALARRYASGTLPVEPRLEIINANKWLAQRYGVFALLGDTRDGGLVDISDAVERTLVMLSGEAEQLNCVEEVQHSRRILREGSSADRQIDHFLLRKVEGDSVAEALKSTIDQIVNETYEGLD